MSQARGFGTVVLLLSLAGCAYHQARRDVPIGSQHKRDRPGEDQEARAGNPRHVSHCAFPSDTGKYVMYQVGGGAPRCGEAPNLCEGTWGWDYSGFAVPSIVELGWWHGRREQGGTGAYKTDGPRPREAIERRHE